MLAGGLAGRFGILTRDGVDDEQVLLFDLLRQGDLGCFVAARDQRRPDQEVEQKFDQGKEVRVAAHTIVPRAIGGRGVAGALVARLIEDAQRQGFLIRPDCSYVAKKFAENPDWADLKA